jgi:hypothetical protein
MKIEELNQVSEYEYALLMATIEAMYDKNKRFDCHKCKIKNKGATNWEETNRKERTIKGCFDAVANWRVDNVMFKKCIGNFVLPSTNNLLTMFNLYERGLLPYGGSVSNQPAKVMQVFEIINARKSEKQEENSDKRSDTQKRVQAKLARKQHGKRN